jgi:uncharacterized protein (TIGR03083 family)
MTADAKDQELVEHLATVWASMTDLGGQLSETEWKQGTEVPGWSVQDNLAHIAGLEWMLLGREQPDHAIPEALAHVKNDIGRRNEVWVDSRRSHSGADVLAEFVEVTGTRLAQLRAFGAEDFGAESWTPVGPGTVRELLPFRVFDSWVHEQDMRRAVDRPGSLESAVAAVALERIVLAMPFVVGKRAGAPDGSVIVFDLSGSLAQSFAIGVEGGRAKRLDALPSAPDVRILTDTETFARLGCGRIDPGATLADARVRLEGDVTLGRRVVEQINFLF